MAQENKNDMSPSPTTGGVGIAGPSPNSPPPVVIAPQTGDNQTAVVPPAEPPNQAPPAQASGQPVPPKPKNNRRKLKWIIIITLLVLLFASTVVAAYLYGRSNERVIIRERPAQPINLPPQAVVVAECVVGRGKQYVLPKDIPGGPIYDVVNDKVIAIEYNLNVTELATNSDNFSNTILRLAKDYPINHLVLIPIIPEDGGQVENAILVTYMVSKEEAKAVTCDSEEP